ncbi:MAG: hypothetical protein HYX47_12845 [Burkholderiales bacterium]|nr:hypothetical protein [Burkholderiales bacterium]
MSTHYVPIDPHQLHADWIGYDHRGFAPSPRQRLLMGAIRQALAERLFDSEAVKDRVAQLVGYARGSDTNVLNVHGGDFGMDVYYARRAREAESRNEAEAETASEMCLQAEESLGTLVFSDYKRTTGVKLLEPVDAWTWKFEGKRGSSRVAGTASVLQLKSAIDRAFQQGARKGPYAQFLASRDCTALLV